MTPSTSTRSSTLRRDSGVLGRVDLSALAAALALVAILLAGLWALVAVLPGLVLVVAMLALPVALPAAAVYVLVSLADR